MDENILSANCPRTRSRQSVITSAVVRRACFVAVAIALAVFLLPTGTVHALLGSTWFSVLDSPDAPDSPEGRVAVLDNTLFFSNALFTVFGPSISQAPARTQYDPGTGVIAVQTLQPPGMPTASGGGLNINRDGSCVVGHQDAGLFTPFHAFRWTQATGPVDLGTLDPANNGSRTSFGTDINQDCSVVVGVSDTAGGVTQHAFRWTSGGMIDLGVPANGGPLSRALGTSADGAVVVGDADFPDPENLASGKGRKAFRWTQTGGFQSLGQLQPAGLSIATAVSGAGTTVVGQATTNSGSAAFRWTTQNQVMESIGALPGHTRAAATAVSDNGRIVAGISHPDFLQYQGPTSPGWNQGTAFRWTQATGMRDLRQILVDGGVNMTGIALLTVTGISPDGQWIIGEATSPQTGLNETAPYIVQVCDGDIGGPCRGASGGSLNIVRTGAGLGTVTSAPAGLDCGATCSAPFTPGTPLALTGTASAGSCFIGWGAPCSGFGACNFTFLSDTSLTATFEPVGINFCDVTPAGWAENYINTIFASSVTTGCTIGTTPQDRRYCPADLVTRAQMAAFIVRAKEGEPAANYCDSGSPFVDVSTSDVFCKYIKRLKELNLTTGFGDPTIYAPNLTIPREQMGAFIIRAIEGEPAVNYCDSGSAFTDVPTSSWACKYIKRLRERSLTTGYGGDPTIYRPELMVPRDQMAAFLARAFYAVP